MTRPPRSLPDIAEHLMAEYEGQLSLSAVTGVVIRLSLDGAEALPTLLDRARAELALIPPGA